MSNPFRKVRIKDIAKMAGVSPGTVDRVIHNRGEVAEDKKERILAIIEELHYQPNILARSLAMKKMFRFVSLLPEYYQGEYWEAPEKGIDKAQREIRNYNVSVEKLYFDQFNAQSFKEASESLLHNVPDAVLMAPTFRNEATLLMGKLHQLGVPGVYIDSNAEDEYYLSYFGQHSYQSGYTAARLLASDLPFDSDILIFKAIRIAGDSNQTLLREEGFKAYFHEKGLADKYRFLHADFSVEDDESNIHEIKMAFAKAVNIRAAVVFNSRAYHLADILKRLGINDVRMMGYDLSGTNVACLKDESISYLIAQRPEDQGYQGIMALCNHLVFEKEIKRINYMPIDILTKENIDYYVDSI